MEPNRNTQSALVDLLDRVLDKGLVIYADVIISVAGVPLIGVNLRAALAGMETMLKYGVMVNEDAKCRTRERDNRMEKKSEVSSIGSRKVVLNRRSQVAMEKNRSEMRTNCPES